jgi:hypothetical protein
MKLRLYGVSVVAGLMTVGLAETADAQMRDRLEKISGIAVGDGIQKNIGGQIGTGRGNNQTPDSSIFIIQRDPFRSVRRGRQLFQRKFLPTQGFSGRDRSGNIAVDASIGAGVVDSCAGCHGRPRGSAGFGGDVFTRPDSRDAPHLFGLGLQEMLGDEMTTDLRAIRAGLAIGQTGTLVSKGVNFGTIRRTGTTTFDTSGVVGVNPDLRVRPFFAQGGTISIREFLVGAFNAEMGIQSDDADLRNAAINRQRITTPAGMILDGALDAIEAPPVTGANGVDPDGDGVSNELPISLVDHEEFYLLNYFKPGTSIPPDKAAEVNTGRTLFTNAGCATCHIATLTINVDRRVADLDTVFSDFNPASPTTSGNPLNRLFATATPKIVTIDDPGTFPVLKLPARGSFVVNNFFADLKRHDLGNNFAERNFDGTLQRQFMTEPLWGVGTTAPYGHDGRSQALEEVILRHGGEALTQRNNFNALSRANKNLLMGFLATLVLFPPDDTASSTSNINPNAANFPQAGHGAIALTPLFNNTADLE